MNKSQVDYTLYLCTDRELMSTDTIEEAVEQAIKGGTTIVQLREKDCSSREFLDIAFKVKKITSKYDVPLIINDRVDIALACDADGVHIGQSDLPLEKVKAIIDSDKIIGVSASNFNEAIKAFEGGADYLGVGAMYSTDTKKDAKAVSMETLLKIRNSCDIPIVVIGGINENTIPDFKNTKINGIAVVSAIIAKKDIENAARKLKEMLRSI